MTDYTAHGAVPVEDAAVDDPPTVDQVLERQRQRDDAVVAAPRSSVTVSFSLPADAGAESASVVGDFNAWDPTQGVMERDGDGAFSCTLDIPTGAVYQYRFLLDGDRWTNDWSAETYTTNAFGGEDSVLDLTDTT